MPVLNSEIAAKFDEVADLLEIEAANPFRVRAYRNAARVVSSWPARLSDAVNDGGLPKIPGIGADLAGQIEEIVTTRKLDGLEKLRKKTSPGLLELLRIPGLGPKRVALLGKKLHVRSIGDLRSIIRDGRLRKLHGFGPKTERRITQKLDEAQKLVTRSEAKGGRIPLWRAEEIAAPILAHLRTLKGIEVICAGSYRRRCENVGDLDILVSVPGAPGAKRYGETIRRVRERFLSFEDRVEIVASGKTKSSMMLRSGLQVDLRIVPASSFGAALHYFTGSKAHNIAVRALGVRRGLKINEYGVFKGRRRIGGGTEEEIYRSVELPYIDPELRENRGELEAAREGSLPKLLALEQIHGDLHVHSSATDGRGSIEAMAAAARRRGYEYIAITDHSRHLSVARGLDPRRLRSQLREIDELNERMGDEFRILKSIEVDILEDGSLDLPDNVLRLLDLTVCSIHFKFNLSRKRQTERILRAMDNPYFRILGHPMARIIGERTQRPPLDLDLEKVMRAAEERACFLEVNSQPERMDLSDVYCRLAKEKGVKLVISSDAHSENDLAFMRVGVEQARRGWIEASDVINTRPWRELRALLRR